MAAARTMHWFRWYHGNADDAKLRLIAAHAHTLPVNVIGVWAMVLESASENTERGTIGSWDTDAVALILGIDAELVSQIISAMQGKLLAGQRVINWPKRQPKRERESNPIEPDGATSDHNDPDTTECHPRGEERRGDKRRKEKSTEKSRSSRSVPTYPSFVAEAKRWWSANIGKITDSRIATCLTTPVEARGWELVFAGMQRFVRERRDKGQAIKLEWFAESYVQYLPRPAELDTNGDPTPAQMERWAAL
jgi:hypothetical protein